jgi:hypothetical protein
MDPLETLKTLHLEMLRVAYKLRSGPPTKDMFTELKTVARRLNAVSKT